jgi:hypothetical protein
MTQALYAHMNNKIKINKLIKKTTLTPVRKAIIKNTNNK